MIYIIENSDNHYKIGYSKNPKKRIKQLNTGNSTDLKIVKLYETKYDSKIEAYLKNYFKPKLIKGEWFELTLEDIDNIENIVKINEHALNSLNKNIFVKIK